ncbi:MAG: SH3 domain-containing protein [Cyanobacteria bacterium J06607_6]
MKLATQLVGSTCGLVVLMGTVGCRSNQSAVPPTSETVTAPGSDAADVALTPAVDSSSPRDRSTLFVDTPSTALPSSGTLTASDPDAQINVRSQPTIDSDSPGQGGTGDLVSLQNRAEGDDGDTWYYVTFEHRELEGWVRGDFIVIAEPATSASIATPAGDRSPSAVLDETCGSPDHLNAYYSTLNFNIYICNSPAGYVYVGHEKGTANTLVARSVMASQTGFVASNGGYDYVIDAETLQIYEGKAPEPILSELVERAERY